jgi:mRNA-degrading endonuclease RelE of RelBE toxin-antitoxin system
MSYNVIIFPTFKREAKRLVKKYNSLKGELETLCAKLAEKPDIGVPLGNGVFKIRLAVAAKGKGKSGGARVITYVKLDNNAILLISIYDKGEKTTISDKKIQALVAEVEKQ